VVECILLKGSDGLAEQTGADKQFLITMRKTESAGQSRMLSTAPHGWSQYLLDRLANV